MKTNSLQIQIIKHLLKADLSDLQAIKNFCDAQQRIHLPSDLPEWLPIQCAADLLHLHHAHLRRLANQRFPLLVDRRRLASGQTGVALHRSAVQELASATMRHSRAAQQEKRAHHTKSAHLSAARDPSAKNEESPGRSERSFTTT